MTGTAPTPVAMRRRATGSTQLLLLAPPWPPLYSPALGVATLAAFVEDASPTRSVVQEYAYLRWADLLKRRFGERGVRIYQHIAEAGAFSGLGDLVFAAAASGEARDVSPHTHPSGVVRSVAELWPELQACVEDFVPDEAARLLDAAEDECVLAVSSSFTQTFAGLAIARLFSAARPDVPVMIGGSNFGPEKASAYFATFPHLTAIAYGEGEHVLAGVLADRDGGLPLTDRPGLVVTGGAGDEAGPAHPSLAMDEVPPPSVQPYFDQFDETNLTDEFRPRLAWELARGCWWGERRHCTFCGLNGSQMAFRRREDPGTASAIMEQVSRYQALDIIIVDNILHPDDIERVFSQIPAEADVQIHLEVKSDLGFEDLRTLRDHGVWHVQPGIESLARRPLRLMRKGVTPWMNVRFLRDAEALGLTVAWNILYGFPGEVDEDYAPMLERLPLLFHLQPPSQPTRISLVRHSPLFADASLGMDDYEPEVHNRILWPDLDEAELVRVSDVFSPRRAHGLSEEAARSIHEIVDRWKDAYPRSSLRQHEDPDGLRVVRQDAAGRTTVLEVEAGDWRHEAWGWFERGLSPEQLRRRIADGVVVERALREWVDELVGAGLLLDDEGVLVSLPTRHTGHVPVKVG